ncbi:MAG: GDP-mannose 4,6-dehydratase [Lachnospiraceae bacterium]|nr:GDP-mannose 4,6-dehydratase [Lachnospiraceae bacterium]
MKSLIIGGAGFVGPYLIRHLRDDLGQDVHVTKMAHETIAEQATIHDLDILKKEDIVALLKEVQPDRIYHLAAQSSVALAWKKTALTVEINIIGAINVMDAVRETVPNARILLVGSCEEYGHIKSEEAHITEDNPLRPGNIYAATKACQNMFGSIYAQAYDLEIMMTRSFNHIGPNQLPQFVVADFCKQVAEIEYMAEKGEKDLPPIRVGNLSARRDFLDVRDVVRAYAMLIEKGQKGETYNVGRGMAYSIQEILDRILSQAKVPIRVEKDPEKFRPVDIELFEADASKLKAATGWAPEIGLDQTIRETVDYWRKKVRTEA